MNEAEHAVAPPWGAAAAAPDPGELRQVNERLLLAGLRARELEEQLRHQLAFTGAITGSLGEGVCALDRTCRITFVNPAAARLLGWPEAALLGRGAHVIAPGPRAASAPVAGDCPLLDAVRAGRTYRNDDDLFARQDGTALPVAYTAAPIIADGEAVGVVLAFHDITERKRAEAALRRAQDDLERRVQERTGALAATVASLRDEIAARQRAEAALRASAARLAEAQRLAHLGSWEHDPGTGATRWSDEIYRILGLAPQAVAPSYQAFLAAVHPDDRASLERAVAAASAGGPGSAHEFRVVRPDGATRTLHGRTAVIRGGSGRPGRLLGTILDITRRKRLEERLLHQAFHDPLTGLANRALFLDRLDHALARRARHRQPVAVVFLDLDRFKVLNDSLGHEAGDQVLVATAERLRGCLRPEDTLARFGGDEFVLLLEQLGDSSEAVCVAERLLAALRDPFAVGDREVFVAASLGVALNRGERQGAGELLRDADTALYRAKQAGKARYVLFDPRMAAAAVERLELETDLRHAVERGEFALHYQPLVELATGRIAGLEALVRWEHPRRGLVLPDDFIPLAEETGLILPLGAWVLRTACRQARAWQGRYPTSPLSLCVNLSVRECQHPGLVEEVAQALRASGLEPRSLILELTESVLLEAAETNAATLRTLKALGVRLALDDFGTGYSSLSYLKRFPVDLLKVDRSFVAGLGHNPEDTAIVGAVVTLAHTLGLQVIAEGIETVEQLAQVQALRCELGQGYHFARALPANELDGLLARGSIVRGAAAVSAGR